MASSVQRSRYIGKITIDHMIHSRFVLHCLTKHTCTFIASYIAMHAALCAFLRMALYLLTRFCRAVHCPRDLVELHLGVFQN